jgi:methionine-rich copper-binding protein CopC
MVATALAHAHYMSSTPGTGQVLTSAPASVVITFAEAVQKTAGSYDITVVRDGGDAATSGAAVVDATDRAKVSVPLKSGLANGRYVVNWRNISDVDGDSAEGAFSFYVGVQPSAADLAKDKELAAIGQEEMMTPTAVAEPSPAVTAPAAAPPAAQTPAPALPRTGEGASTGGGGAWWIIAVGGGGILLTGIALAGKRRFA